MGKAKLGASLSHEIAPPVEDSKSEISRESPSEKPTPLPPEVRAIQQQTEAIQQQNALRNLELEGRRLEIEKQRETTPQSSLKTKN
jgi:hypothetical protein